MQSLRYDTPENHKFKSKTIEEFKGKLENLTDIDINSFLLLKDNCIIAELNKTPFNKKMAQALYSVSKSVTSLGVGIAIDMGYFSTEDNIVSFFPDKLPENPGENLQRIKVKHLLTMTPGMDKNYYKKGCINDDWVKLFLDLDFLKTPGTHYLYNNLTSHMLSAIIQKTTGESLLDFVNRYLFMPLDIPKPLWDTCPMGITLGADGISLSTESFAKLGVLLLNKGDYFGKRIVSNKYIEKATSPLVVKQNKIDRDKYCGHHFGYQFHVGLGGNYRAYGAFCQLCFVSPKNNLIAVATSSNSDIEKLLSLIYTYLLN